MKRYFLSILALMFIIVISPTIFSSSAPEESTEKGKDMTIEFNTDDEKISYAIGVDIASTFAKNNFDINPDFFVKGFNEAMSGKELALSPSEIQEQLMNFQMKLMEKQMAAQGAVMDKNKKEGLAFLEENKKQEGVKTTGSGLQYKVLTEGKGNNPKATSTVTVHYQGTLLDGTIFDSSIERDQPATFALNQVIPGWTEGVQLMNKGSKFQFFIPSDLAYGDRGAGQDIGPGSTLIFEVELLDFK